MIRIARMEDTDHQEQLIAQLLTGATQKEIRNEIDRLKGKPSKSASSESPKPKRVYHTKYKATVIVQSQTSRLTTDQTIDALQEAMGQATKS
jgi:hypothetical protein